MNIDLQIQRMLAGATGSRGPIPGSESAKSSGSKTASFNKGRERTKAESQAAVENGRKQAERYARKDFTQAELEGWQRAADRCRERAWLRRMERWAKSDKPPVGRVFVRIKKVRCIECGRWGARLHDKLHLECLQLKIEARKMSMLRECAGCKKLFNPAGTFKNLKKWCEDCVDIRERAFKYGCEYEKVDSVKVFERDSWCCQHCGKNTPKELMGSLDELAPTLDHILPMSHQGAHSYQNTQLLCRGCNSRKSNRLDQEPKLQGTNIEGFKKAKWKAPKLPIVEKVCECGCGETYRPGNPNFKQGHWHRTPEGREAAIQRERDRANSFEDVVGFLVVNGKH